jgi:hypothetical protein
MASSSDWAQLNLEEQSLDIFASHSLSFTTDVETFLDHFLQIGSRGLSQVLK